MVVEEITEVWAEKGKEENLGIEMDALSRRLSKGTRWY